MKYFGIFVGLLLTVLIGIYTILFTSMGNAIISPIVEKKINEALSLSTSLTKFKLTINTFEVILQLDSDNSIETLGSFSILDQSIDATYDVKLNKLEALQKLTQKQLNGKLHTDGTVIGSLKEITIKGRSDVAHSVTSYDIFLIDFNPEQIIANISNAKIDKLLYLAGEPSFASGDLNVDLKLENLDPNNLQGDANIIVSEGQFNSKVLNKFYNVDLPHTNFNASLDSKLNGENIIYKILFDSNLAKIDSKGTVVPKVVGMDLEYKVSIKKLELLKPLTNAPLKGPLALNGTIKGDKKSLLLNGYTDIAKSKTNFTANLEEFKPRSIQAQMKHLKLTPLFTMLSQPHYASGTLDLTIDIEDARVGHLNGKVDTYLSKGKLNGKVLSKEMNMTNVPNTPFSLKTLSTLNENIIDTNMNFDSSLITMNSKHAKIDIKDSVITADYKVNLLDLSKLYFITEHPLIGELSLFGDLKKDDHLLFTLHSNTLGGRLDAKLLDDNFNANLENIETLEALHMLTYPEVFKSLLNGKLDYNIATKKGYLDSKLSDGLFTQNIMMDLYRDYAHRNLYKERFNGTLKTDIIDSKTYTDLYLYSAKSSIKTDKMSLDTKDRHIDAKVEIVANKNPLNIYIKGSLDKPDIKIDAQQIIEKEATKQLNKLFQKLF